MLDCLTCHPHPPSSCPLVAPSPPSCRPLTTLLLPPRHPLAALLSPPRRSLVAPMLPSCHPLVILLFVALSLHCLHPRWQPTMTHICPLPFRASESHFSLFFFCFSNPTTAFFFHS